MLFPGEGRAAIRSNTEFTRHLVIAIWNCVWNDENNPIAITTWRLTRRGLNPGLDRIVDTKCNANIYIIFWHNNQYGKLLGYKVYRWYKPNFVQWCPSIRTILKQMILSLLAYVLIDLILPFKIVPVLIDIDFNDGGYFWLKTCDASVNFRG